MSGDAVGGDDTLIASPNTNSVLIGDAFYFYDNARGGDDTLIAGNSPGNRLYGDAQYFSSGGSGGDDRLIGGAGDDRMWGDASSRELGATGADTFVFLPNNGNDTIFDFEPGKDLIELRGITVSTFPGNAKAWSKLPAHVKAKFTEPMTFDNLHIEETDGGSVIRTGPDDSVTVLGVTGLGEGDFLFV